MTFSELRLKLGIRFFSLNKEYIFSCLPNDPYYDMIVKKPKDHVIFENIKEPIYKLAEEISDSSLWAVERIRVFSNFKYVFKHKKRDYHFSFYNGMANLSFKLNRYEQDYIGKFIVDAVEQYKEMGEGLGSDKQIKQREKITRKFR